MGNTFKSEKKNVSDHHWHTRSDQLLTQNVKEMEIVSFRCYVEFLRIIPWEKDEEIPINPSMDCKIIQMRKEDTMEWVVSSSILLKMKQSYEGKLFYSPNYGHDGNWCFACEPYPKKQRNRKGYIVLHLFLMKMPAQFESVTM